MDFFTIYLPIAGIHFNVLLLLLIGFTVGVCGGFFGIGGAWIVTPALNIFGFPMPYAIGTDLAHMGGKSIVSTIRHGKFGNVDVRLGVSMIVGTTVGMELGASLVMYLERVGLAESVHPQDLHRLPRADRQLRALRLHQPRAPQRARRRSRARRRRPAETFAQRLQRIRIPPMIHFKASGITCSLWLPVLVGLITGVVASVLGVGGGFIRMPALIYLVGCPTAGGGGHRPVRGDDHRRLRRVHLRRQGPGRPDRGDVDAARRGGRRAARHGGRQVRARLLDPPALRGHHLHRLRLGAAQAARSSRSPPRS